MTSFHDTHFHLDLFDDPQNIVELIEKEKIYTIAVTNIPEVFHFTSNIARECKYVRAALGFHPELASRYKHQLPLFEELLSQTRYVGEVGLDNYNKTPSDYLVQKQIFGKIISACREAGNKILTVHSRRAEKDVIDIIGIDFPGKVILHWFSGSAKEIERALSNGFYFSINSAMTKSENGKSIIARIPTERILVETDGPFIKVNNNLATPSLSSEIVSEISYLKRQANFAEIINKNFQSLISN